MSKTQDPDKATRSRSSADMSPGMAEANPGIADESREDKAHAISRHNRVPLGGAVQSLTIPLSLQQQLVAEDKHIHYVLDNERICFLILILPKFFPWALYQKTEKIR